MASLIELFDQLDLHFAVVSETWMKGGDKFDRNVRRLADSEGLNIIEKNRSRGRGGGVAILFKPGRVSLKRANIVGNNFELVGATGRTVDDSRTIVVMAAYYPPKMTVAEVNKMNECISGGEKPLTLLRASTPKRSAKCCCQA